jgi:RecJ-like exonuclease
LDVWGTGAYIGRKRFDERKARKEAFERKALQVRLIAALKARFNQMNFDGYWQKDICMNWHPVKGCMAEEVNCDECGSFNRIKPQFCVRCGATFFEREKNRFVKECRIARKKQHQRKWMVMYGQNGRSKAAIG